MKHNHNHCMHDLKYCDHCDMVYCTKCDREWGGHKHEYWYWGGIPYRVTWASTVSDGSYGYTIYNATNNAECKDQSVYTAFNSQTNKDDFISHSH